MKVRPIILKFGGTSVADRAAFERAADIVRSRKEKHPVVITSAMKGVTDALLESFSLASNGNLEDAFAGLEAHFERHLQVADALLGEEVFGSTIEKARQELRELLSAARANRMAQDELQDAIIAYGELLAAKLLTAVLRAGNLPARYVDARRCIITDDNYTQANPLPEETANYAHARISPWLAAGEIPVLGGFIASSIGGATTTLGRGGSDYSAALIGAALNAVAIEIWTDVSGVMTTDPRVVKDARTINTLSYDEVAELAYFGAKVLHPKTAQPAIERDTPIYVLNSYRPQDSGTKVARNVEGSLLAVKAIAQKKKIVLLRVGPVNEQRTESLLKLVFEVLEKTNAKTDVIASSDSRICLALQESEELPSVVASLKKLGNIEEEYGKTLICLVGENLNQTPSLISRAFGAIGDVRVALLAQGGSNNSLTFVVDEQNADETVRRLHNALFPAENFARSAATSNQFASTEAFTFSRSVQRAHSRSALL